MSLGFPICDNGNITLQAVHERCQEQKWHPRDPRRCHTLPLQPRLFADSLCSGHQVVWLLLLSGALFRVLLCLYLPPILPECPFTASSFPDYSNQRGLCCRPSASLCILIPLAIRALLGFELLVSSLHLTCKRGSVSNVGGDGETDLPSERRDLDGTGRKEVAGRCPEKMEAKEQAYKLLGEGVRALQTEKLLISLHSSFPCSIRDLLRLP